VDTTPDYNSDQLFKSNLTFCVVGVFTLQTDEWCIHDRLFNDDIDIDIQVIHERGVFEFLFAATHYTQQYLDFKF
jgi:hypothetical protein